MHVPIKSGKLSPNICRWCYLRMCLATGCRMGIVRASSQWIVSAARQINQSADIISLMLHNSKFNDHCCGPRSRLWVRKAKFCLPPATEVLWFYPESKMVFVLPSIFLSFNLLSLYFTVKRHIRTSTPPLPTPPTSWTYRLTVWIWGIPSFLCTWRQTL